MMQESKKKRSGVHISKTENRLEDQNAELQHHINLVEENVSTDLANLHDDVEALRSLVEEKTKIILRLQEMIIAGQKIEEYEKDIKENGKSLVEMLFKLRNLFEKLEEIDLVGECDTLVNQLETDGKQFLLNIREIKNTNDQKKFMQGVSEYFSEKKEKIEQITKIAERHFAIWLSSKLREDISDYKRRLIEIARSIRKHIEHVKAFGLLRAVDEQISYIEDNGLQLSIALASFNRDIQNFVIGDGQDIDESYRIFELTTKYVNEVTDALDQILGQIKLISEAKAKTQRLLIKLGNCFILISYMGLYLLASSFQGLLSSNPIKLVTWFVVGMVAVTVVYLIYVLLAKYLNSKNFSSPEKHQRKRKMLLFSCLFVLFGVFVNLSLTSFFPQWAYPLSLQIVRGLFQVNPENPVVVILGHVSIAISLIAVLVAVGVRINKFMKKSR